MSFTKRFKTAAKKLAEFIIKKHPDAHFSYECYLAKKRNSNRASLNQRQRRKLNRRILSAGGKLS